MKTINTLLTMAVLFGVNCESRGQSSGGSADLLGGSGNAKDLYTAPPPVQQASHDCQDAKQYLSDHGKTVPQDCGQAIQLASDLAAQEYANEMTLQMSQNTGGTQPVADSPIPVAVDEKKIPRKKKVQPKSPVLSSQASSPQPGTSDIDGLFGGLSQFDTGSGFGGFQNTQMTTTTDEGIPMPPMQPSGNANGSQSDAIDGLSAAYDNNTPPTKPTIASYDPGIWASKDDVLKATASEPGIPSYSSTPDPQPVASFEPGIWQSKNDVLNQVTDNSTKAYGSFSSQPAEQESASPLDIGHAPQDQSVIDNLLPAQTTSQAATIGPSIACANLGVGGTLGLSTSDNGLPGYTGGENASLCLNWQSGDLYFVNTFSQPDPTGFALGAEFHAELALSLPKELPIQETSNNKSITLGPVGIGFNSDSTRADLWVATLTMDNNANLDSEGVKFNVSGKLKPKAGFAMSDTIDTTTVTPLGNIYSYQYEDFIATPAIGFPDLSTQK